MKKLNFIKPYKINNKSNLYNIIIVILLILTIINIAFKFKDNNIIDNLFIDKELLKDEIKLKEEYILNNKNEKESKMNNENYSIYFKDIISNVPENIFLTRSYIDNNKLIIEGETESRDDILRFKNKLNLNYNFKINYINDIEGKYFNFILEHLIVGDSNEE